MIELDKKDIAESIRAINSCLTDAYDNFIKSQYIRQDVFNEYEIISEYLMERAFISTLTLFEVYSLDKNYEKVNRLYIQAKKEGLLKSLMGIEDPYLVYGECLHNYLDAIAISFNVDFHKGVISKEIIDILKAVQYSITDPDMFNSPPSDEQELHRRIEGVLKCIFPNLRHKPQLNKPIKNFEPDTGLPSIRTLIEYKFISDKAQAKTVADQVLADTRGYISKEWEKFIYIIYETRRIKPESEWKQLLKECDVKNTEIVVLSGEPIMKNDIKRRKFKRRNIK
jgi:hypothetical protein